MTESLAPKQGNKKSVVLIEYPRKGSWAVGFATKKNNGEVVIKDLEDIKISIDIVDVFRPSKEAPDIAKKAAKIGSKVLWLQYGLHSDEAEKISVNYKMKYVSDKCIKQEYQKIFEKSNPVFPVLRN